MCDEDIIKNTYCLLKLISEVDNGEIEREKLIQLTKKVKDKLLEDNNIVLGFDFLNFPSDFHSNGFNEVLDFSLSSDYLMEKHSSIRYKITPRGTNFIENTPKIFEDCLDGESKKYINKAIKELVPNE